MLEGVNCGLLRKFRYLFFVIIIVSEEDKLELSVAVTITLLSPSCIGTSAIVQLSVPVADPCVERDFHLTSLIGFAEITMPATEIFSLVVA
jgi:hypothetical protein